MLIFGGLTQRKRSFDDAKWDETFDPKKHRNYDVYNYCEGLKALNETKRTYYTLTCSEEMLNDIWMYNTRAKTWTWVKPSYNGNLYLYVKQPSARYAHAGAYVHLLD